MQAILPALFYLMQAILPALFYLMQAILPALFYLMQAILEQDINFIINYTTLLCCGENTGMEVGKVEGRVRGRE